MSVRLGPFEIETRFATGGMGEIWRGVHIEQNVPVAIKVITGPNAVLPEYMDEFRREVQAVARLNHPNVVQVFDYGTLPDEVRDLPGQLLPGAPYLVMEYASRGSLADEGELLNWRDLKNILMSVLGGLAHAHARGVIHRDIKPGNVLLGSHHESPPRIILTDFGVAHATDRVTRTDAVDLTSRSTEEASGTPRYMAPEQFMGQWRDYGPATDLYAIGIMAYHLACGELPFKGGTFMLLAMSHINNDFPALKPKIEVPDGFEQWIRRLAEKNPHDRFKSAANAAWALAQLDDSALLFGELSNIVSDSTQYEEEQDDFDSTDMLPTRIDFALPEAVRVFQMSRSYRAGAYRDVPPLPITWQEAEPPKAQVSLVGSGLGLFGLRTIPLVGRESERSVLWDAFKKVHTDQVPHTIVIRGHSGAGKSGIAEWFMNLVDEIGAATPFKASHSSTPGLMHGLGWMLNSHFRCAGLVADDLTVRLTEALDRYDVADAPTVSGLSEIMRTDLRDTATTTTAVRFTHAEQRYAIIRDVIDQTTPERPVVIWLDDAHWEPDSLEFVRWAMENPGRTDHPYLFVVTVLDEAVLDRPDSEVALNTLLARDDVDIINVPPLSEQETAQLVREYLYLPLELANDVARRSAGSPLFAIQLVEDWVKRGVLEVEGGTFTVRHGETAEVPSDAESLWRSRLDNLVAQLTAAKDEEDGDGDALLTEEDARRSIEIAAALGQDVNLDEWLHACELSGVAANRSIVAELERLRFAKPSDAGFSFINAQLVDMLREEARESGRHEDHNMLCARMLTSRYGEEHPGLAQRVGRHFVEARAHQLAVTCLEEAYQRAHGTSEQREINEINELLERCYQSMGVPDGDMRWAELWVRRAVPKIYSQDPDVFDEGLNLLRRSEEIAREHERTRVLAGILRAQAWACIHASQIEEGLRKAHEALELTTSGGSLEASCHRTIGHLLLVDGQLEEASMHLEEAVALSPNSVHAIWARQQLAAAALIRGHFADAEQLLEDALADAVQHGVLMAQAQIRETYGFLAERRGNFALAEEHHREAMSLRGTVSSDSTLHAKSREYLARTILAQDRFEEAQGILEPLAERLSAGAKGFYTHLDDARLACAAGLGDWDAWEQLVEPALSFDDFSPTSVHARALLTAARDARDAGRFSDARAVYDRAAALLRQHEVELDVADAMSAESADIEDRVDVAAPQPDEASMEDSSTHFPVSHTGEHEFPDDPSAPVMTTELTEDSDPMDEPDFTGRVQVLSLPVDPAENFGQFGFDLGSEADDEWSEPSSDEGTDGFGNDPIDVFRVADLRAAVSTDPPARNADRHSIDESQPPSERNLPAALTDEAAPSTGEHDSVAEEEADS